MNALKFSTLGFVILLIFACDGEVLPPSQGCSDNTITYKNSAKEILDLTCAYSGCHDGSSGAPGDFTSYRAMQRYLKDGSFTERVINMKDNPARGMPPNKSVYPHSLQDDLTAAQLEIIRCWVENSFPE